jgi:hypothetical protein
MRVHDYGVIRHTFATLHTVVRIFEQTGWEAFRRLCDYLCDCLDISFNLSLHTRHFHFKDSNKLK